MVTLLLKQYELVRSSREVVLGFIETEVGEDLNTPVPAFEGKTIRYLLVHTANTYLHWLGYFALKHQINFHDDATLTTIGQIMPVYVQADRITTDFLHRFAGRIEERISSTLPRDRHATASPLELFTHVITHEFHHKGQIMTMCRLLGYTPPDTDVIRF
ncbi:MAG TPA: DinB family protein [Mucilaginibacter sp.]|jgi:uncharacterized damage-inducible protein DinB|nr:DinB family protein [Mucilaginibacter sp.]